MSEDPIIRPMTAADISDIMAIERRTETVPHWERTTYLDCLWNDPKGALQRTTLVAEHGEKLAGFAVLRLLLIPESVEAELESIVVVAEQRGKGIGRRLLHRVVELVKDRGATWIDLEVRASNTLARQFYQAFGFAETGRRLRYYVDPEDDAVLMRINL